MIVQARLFKLTGETLSVDVDSSSNIIIVDDNGTERYFVRNHNTRIKYGYDEIESKTTTCIKIEKQNIYILFSGYGDENGIILGTYMQFDEAEKAALKMMKNDSWKLVANNTNYYCWLYDDAFLRIISRRIEDSTVVDTKAADLFL